MPGDNGLFVSTGLDKLLKVFLDTIHVATHCILVHSCCESHFLKVEWSCSNFVLSSNSTNKLHEATLHEPLS